MDCGKIITENQLIFCKEGDFMQAIKAVYDGTGFKPIQPIPVNGEYAVFIIFVEPLNRPAENANVTEEKLPRTTARGFLKDKVWMSADFNEPLEEMKEYME